MKILLAIDESSYSSEAVNSVGTRPWPAGTVVRVLSAVQVLPPPAAELWYDAGGNLERVQQELQEDAQELTLHTVETLSAAGLASEAIVRIGDARSVIVDEAEDWEADLIVIGSHGYTGLKRLLIGSVAQSVVAHAPCSVEVVRSRKAGAYHGRAFKE